MKETSLKVMRGLGLAHTLAQAFGNSQATCGNKREWTDWYLNALTTKRGKVLLGLFLDVLRGDMEIVPKERIIDQDSIKPGDSVVGPYKKNGTVLFNRPYLAHQKTIPLGKLKLGVASEYWTKAYSGGGLDIPENHVDVPWYKPELLQVDKENILPKYLNGFSLPGIAVRDFFVANPHHIPERFSETILFWGTICKTDNEYYVPALDYNGYARSRVVCKYKYEGDKVVAYDFKTLGHYEAAVFI